VSLLRNLALLALVIYRPNPILILILLLAGSELRRRWQTRHAPVRQRDERHYGAA
jgi:hypothetical protein